MSRSENAVVQPSAADDTRTVRERRPVSGPTGRTADLPAIFKQIELEIPRLRRYARFLVRNPDYADDMVQEALTRAVAKIDQWRPDSNLTAWLFVILRNTVINEVRRNNRRPSLDGLEDGHPALAVSGGQEERQAIIALQQAVSRLPADHRDVLLLVAVEGFQYEEAAEILNVPVGTVRSRLSRARTALRRLMDLDDPQGEPHGDA